MKTAIITGITGQDGSYLAEILLDKGYFVVGLKRRTSLLCTDRIDHIYNNKMFKLEYYDLNDTGAIWRIINKYKPNEFYNMACQSHVKVSFEIPEHTVDGIALGTLRILNAIKELSPRTKFYQASSSEMFGDNPNYPYREDSRFMPASPYACAKVFAHNLVRNYRESYGLFACSGILFNHESERRGETFVTRKITMAAARIKQGKQSTLFLGNINSSRDWGYAKDYMEAVWKMMQRKEPEDFIIATGETNTVSAFLQEVFDLAGLDISKHVKIDERLFRPHEVPVLIGDARKANYVLGWKPKTDMKQLAKIMYEADFDLIKKEK